MSNNKSNTKSFMQFLKEDINDIDPYSEEKWKDEDEVKIGEDDFDDDDRELTPLEQVEEAIDWAIDQGKTTGEIRSHINNYLDNHWSKKKDGDDDDDKGDEEIKRFEGF